MAATTTAGVRDERASTYTAGSGDELAVRGLFQQMVESWNRGDGAAYAANFTEDSDYIAFDGSHIKGRQANADHHQKLFDTFLKGSRLQGQVDSVKFLTADVALVHASGTVLLSWQKRPAPGRFSIQTMVAVKRDGVWRFAAFHNTRVQRRSWLMSLLMLLGRK